MKTSLLSTSRKQFPFFKGFVITAFLVLFSSISVWATHYRYGNIQWTDNGGNKVTFKIQQAWRWSYFGNPVLGSTVNIAAADGAVPFEFGDGQSVDIQIKVTSINASEDWFFGEVTYVHTYAAPGNYTASFEGSARISTLKNNADGSFRLHTLVNVGNGAHSTVSTVVPIVDLPVNKASASFTIPVVDPDGNTVSFRLATASEAAGTGNPYVQPTGLSVNASSGLVTFSTVGKTVGDLYTSQIVISNGVTEIAVDFIIRIVPNPPPSTPPYFVYPPTPDNGHTFNVNVGSLLSFNVTAKDDDPGSSVTLTVVGMPPGATTTPALPTNGQPVTTQFNWTPTISNVGSYILVFTATDNTGISVTTQVNIKVSAVCDPNFSSSIAVVPSPTIPGGDANTIYIGNGPQSVTLTASATGGNGGNTYDWGSAGTGASILVSPSITTTYTVTVTDAGGCTTESSVIIYVVNTPTLSCSVQKVSDVKCKGESNGSATVTPTGGIGGYTYLWDDNETTATATMLNAGSHSVTVTDSKSNTSNCNVTISEPDLALSCSVQKVLDVKCKGESNGSATVTPAGGNGGYTYLWDDNETTATATTLNAGSHSVTVTDSKGCTSNCNVTISEPDLALSCSVQKVADVKCNGQSNGSATVIPTGGTSDYSYLWDDGEITATATALSAGNHSVTVTDSKGCTSSCNVSIDEPQPLVCSITKPTTLTCNSTGNQLCATVSGGTGAIKYKWKSNNTAWVITSGKGTNCITYTAGSSSASDVKFTLTITDEHGCKSTCTIKLSCGCSFVTNGVATKTNKQCYQLTGTAFHSAGSVFSNAPVNLKKSFQINASLYFGVNDDGGDGIAFVLQNEGPHYIGNYGAGIGYHRFDGIGCGPIDNPGQAPSFIVEFDTYENHNIVYCKDIGDPPGDHIGFMSHSDAFHTSQHALSAPQEFGANIEDGKYHDVQFDWNASTKTMTVTFTVTNTPLVKKTYVYTGDIVKKLFSGNSMVYFGFTGSNGSFSPNEHRVCINTPCAPPYITQQPSFVQGSTNTANSSELLAQKNTVSVFPNPFSSELIFKFKSPANGHATLELFDMVGKRLAVVYDGEVKFQALYNFNYKVPAEYRVPMMYKITIGEEIYHGFLMPTR